MSAIWRAVDGDAVSTYHHLSIVLGPLWFNAGWSRRPFLAANLGLGRRDIGFMWSPSAWFRLR